jgi:hypothetical protein
MAAQSKGVRWLTGDADAMRERHTARLRALYTETFNANDALRVDLRGQIYALTFDFVMSETQLRSRVDRAGAAFVAMCQHGAKLGVLADALRGLGVNVDGYGDLDGRDGTLSLGLGDGVIGADVDEVAKEIA